MTNEIDMSLTRNVIKLVEEEAVALIKKRLLSVKSIILYGSCARGDFGEDSDIDIAVLIDAERSGSDLIAEELSKISTELALKYFAVVNCIFIPYREYLERKEWYHFYRNIAEEGIYIYESGVSC